jgi:hypothetical protein
MSFFGGTETALAVDMTRRSLPLHLISIASALALALCLLTAERLSPMLGMAAARFDPIPHPDGKMVDAAGAIATTLLDSGLFDAPFKRVDARPEAEAQAH